LTFTKTDIPDVVIIEPKVFGDSRGYFLESYKKELLDNFLDKEIKFVQDNESMSSYGVLRGLHFQIPPYSQSKLVKVSKGKILDVVVDIRKGSPTFGKHIAVELSAENKKQLFIPRGFAHGFIVLSDEAIFSYKVDNYYSFEHDRGIAFDDESLGIDWKLDSTLFNLSDKDKKQPKLKDSHELFDFEVDYYE
jgi:dTDP-4-dehydrorhamnose 3,5-epimerase